MSTVAPPSTLKTYQINQLIITKQEHDFGCIFPAKAKRIFKVSNHFSRTKNVPLVCYFRQISLQTYVKVTAVFKRYVL